jgi:hypothetical protein
MNIYVCIYIYIYIYIHTYRDDSLTAVEELKKGLTGFKTIPYILMFMYMHIDKCMNVYNYVYI